MCSVENISGEKRDINQEDVTKIIRGESVLVLKPGEFVVAASGDMLSLQSLNGSTVTLILYEESGGVRAVANIYTSEFFSEESCRAFLGRMYEEFLGLGVIKEHIRAKIAGGANLGLGGSYGGNNVAPVKEFCAQKEIAVVSEKLYGSMPVIVLVSEDSRVLVRSFNNPIIASRLNRRDSLLYGIEFSEEGVEGSEAQESDFTLEEVIDLSFLD